jgi:hypothetical protein
MGVNNKIIKDMGVNDKIIKDMGVNNTIIKDMGVNEHVRLSYFINKHKSMLSNRAFIAVLHFTVIIWYSIMSIIHTLKFM